MRPGSATAGLIQRDRERLWHPYAPASPTLPLWEVGIHHCLGAKLAELEATVIVRETAVALPQLRLRDDAPEWIPHLSFQAPKTVPVRDGKG